MLTVIDPAETHRLVTLLAVRRELNVIDEIDDVFLTSLIDQASATARSWCRRTFAEETVSETVYLDRPASPIELTRYPLTEIASVTVAGTVLDPAEYEVEEDPGWLYRLDASGGRCARFCGRVVVEYTGGYTLPDAARPTLPDDIQRGALLLVKGAYFARTRDPAIRSESVEGAGIVRLLQRRGGRSATRSRGASKAVSRSTGRMTSNMMLAAVRIGVQ